MDVYSKKFIVALQDKIYRRKSFDGLDYSPLAKSTLASQPGRKANSRLNDTGQFQKHAYNAVVTDTGFTISTIYGRSEDIIKYNDAASPEKNSHIAKPPYIKPRNSADIQAMPEFTAFIKDLTTTVETQIGQTIEDEFNETLELHIGTK